MTPLSLQQFRTRSRPLLRELKTLSHWEALGESQSSREELISTGLDQIFERVSLFEDVGPAPLRYELFWHLLRVLVRKRGSRSERATLAHTHILENTDQYFGWDALVAGFGEAASYQLTEEEPWWKGGVFSSVHRERRELEREHGKGTPELERALEESGYSRITQESYRLRVKRPILEARLTTGFEPLMYAVRLILAVTGKQAWQIGEEGEVLVEDEAALTSSYAEIVSAWRHQHEPTRVAMPHQQLATLTHEAQVLSALVGTSSAPRSIPGLKAHPTEPGKLLVYSEKLVRQTRSDGSPAQDLEKYLVVPETDGAEADGADAFSTLIQRLKEMGELSDVQRRNHVSDIPRVVAGMFRAAVEDREMVGLGIAPGSFLDRNSAARLTNLIGFDDSQHRQRERVRRVRTWLETIELSRTWTQQDPKTQKIQQVRMTDPIISRIGGKVEVSQGLASQGFSRLATYYKWQIPHHIWQTCVPGSGVEGFMLLDARAFQLDANMSHSTSEPFNLYWTIVQRAYNASRTRQDSEKISADGVFQPKLSTLYRWAGMERPSDAHNPGRKLERLHMALSAMVDRGLLLDWHSVLLTSEHEFDTEAFEHERVKLHLPESFLMNLPERAFIGTEKRRGSARRIG